MRKNKYAKSAVIFPGVSLGEGGEIEDFVLIGKPYSHKPPKALSPKTMIGDNFNIRSHAVIYCANKIGDNFTTGHHVLVRQGNIIGDNVSIGSGTVIEHHVKIGNNVRIHSKAFVPEYSVLEDNCWIGPAAVLTNTYHPKCPKAKECLRGPIIKKGAIIGANATILPGIIIGENALVGAGAVVVSSVKPDSVVVGNPARKIKSIKGLKCLSGITKRPY
ncbi:MAG: acyltransferase [Candidatus Omnitrophota bacterium]